MDKTVVIERELEKEFYKLYNETRLMLIKEFEELNNLSRLESIHYAQMIMNRYMFICFAEDIDLLPAQVSTDTILTPILKGNLRHGSIWQRLNELFLDINEGNEYKKISQYNGSIFKENLEQLKIRDIVKDQKFFNDVYQNWKFEEYEKDINTNLGPYGQKVNPIYRNMLTISTFDFSTELDVNILGHIFENSIGDIEELKADSKGRRKKEGIFYTPDYITDYICRNTIIPYLSKNGEAETIAELIQEYSTGHEIETLESKVMNIKIVDPACGSGAFLNKASDILLEIHKSIYAFKRSKYTATIETKGGKGKDKVKRTATHIKLDSYFDEISARREILIHNIYGVDLNEESVDITKLSLFLKVCQENRKLPDLENNIKCGNSLIDDPEFTDKPFEWENEFPEIFQEGGFDVVIGNPPYVRHHKIKDVKPYLKDNYKVYTGLADLYVYFFEKGINVLKDGGMFSFISSDKFLKVTYGENLRKFILKYNFRGYYNFTGKGIFVDASVDPCVTIIKKEPSKNEDILIVNDEYEMNLSKLDETPWILENQETMSILNNINRNKIQLGDIEDLKIYMGIFTGLNKVFIINEQLKNELLKKDPNSSDLIKPIITGKDIKKWKIHDRHEFLILSNFSDINDLKRYIAIYEYLNSFKQPLKNRGQVKRGDHPWWTLSNNPSEAFLSEFDKPKLVYPEISTEIFSVFDDNQYFTNKKAFIITCNSYDIKFLSVLMSSKVLNYFFKKNCVPLSRTSKNPTEKPRYNLSKYFVEKLPISPATLEEQKPFIEKADEMLELNRKVQNEVNSFKDWLMHTFNIEKLSQKLEKYYKLSFDDFLNEVKKKKVNVTSRGNYQTLKEEFEKSITIINPLLQKIKETDNEIDQMVYTLYGLTPKEIKIIEDSLNSN